MVKPYWHTKDYIKLTQLSPYRSSRLQMFFKKVFLKILQYLEENTCVGLKACNFIKKRLQHKCFPENIAKFLRTTFFIEHLWWLLVFLLMMVINVYSTEYLRQSQKNSQKSID